MKSTNESWQPTPGSRRRFQWLLARRGCAFRWAGGRVLPLLTILTAMGGCTGPQPRFADVPYVPPPPAPERRVFEVSTLDSSKLAPREREVYTEVYRHLFAYCKPMTAGYRPLPEKFFLSCRKQDVGQDLLSQLQVEGYQVGPGSHFEVGKGFHCSASDIQWISADEAKVWAGILYGEVGGQWGFFTLRKSGEKWSVTSWRVTMVAEPGEGADRGVTPRVVTISAPNSAFEATPGSALVSSLAPWSGEPQLQG